jgi:hypothetical protein
MAAINPRDKQKQRALDEALQSRMSARFERRLRTEIAATMRQAASAYEARGELAIPIALDDHSAALQRTLAADYSHVAGHFGNRLLQEAKGYAGPDVTKASITELLAFGISDFIGQWVARKVTQINTTTERQIRGIIRAGLDEGLGIDKIGRRIRDFAQPMSALRAHVIARTETHTAANFGSQRAAELTGLQLRREWVASMDDRTRESPPDSFDHVEADGQVVGMKQPFLVSGEGLMYPGDPAGSAGNVIMCRCSVAYIYD